jgi:hypothetical protein
MTIRARLLVASMPHELLDVNPIMDKKLVLKL